MTAINTTERLQKLREFMKKNDLNSYLVLSGDAHMSEYIADVDARRAFISGFDGSAGLCVVTLDKAYLFTDGRYFLQASQQLDDNWTLMKQGLPNTPNWYQFSVDSLPKNGKLGVDPKLISVDDANKIKDLLKKSDNGGQLVAIDDNLIDKVWQEQQPKRPSNKIFVLEEKYAGKAFQSKIEELLIELKKKNFYGIVLSQLDEIAWLFNLRGSDIIYNPVFFAYALITLDKVILYVNKEQLDDNVYQYLGNSVEIQPYEAIFKQLDELKVNQLVKLEHNKILVPKTSNWALVQILGDYIKLDSSPIVLSKALKNNTELEGFRQCHIRDGLALVKYFCWLEHKLKDQNYDQNPISEAQAADQLLEFRKQQKDFISESFATISSTGPNGAIIHYHPTHEKCDLIDSKKMYLCDSGGQYRDGTTDVTRTWHFGTPTEFEKLAFTRVLQGVITLETQTFPAGTTGFHLDPIVRAPLWRSGLDFRHGVGHGVGSFLNVHEGPHGISFRPSSLEIPLQPSMTVTNEPGYYEDGQFGIRTENILIVKEVGKGFGGIQHLGFENVTLVPIHTQLIEKSILSSFEVDYLNKYHERVFNILSTYLKEDPVTLEWLKKQTLPI